MSKHVFDLFDTQQILHVKNAERTSGPVHKDPSNPLFIEDFFGNPPRQWEQRYDNGYPNVFYDTDIEAYRCYYTCFIEDLDSAQHELDTRERRHYLPRRDRKTALLYAYSKDGVHWIKPTLGLVVYKGSTDNNIVYDWAHGASVFKDDQETNPARRYKMVMKYDKISRMAVAFSADGIVWSEAIPWPTYNPAGDTHNFAYRDKKTGHYVVITRTWAGVRLVARSESDDFIHWSEPVEIYRGNGLDDQVYAMPVFWHDDWLVGLAAIYHGGDQANTHFDTVDSEIMLSRDGIHWERLNPGKPFVPRGAGIYPAGACDCGCVFLSPPVCDDGTYMFYYMGSNGYHTDFRETSLCRCLLDRERLAGYRSLDNDFGWLTTRPFMLTGDDVTVTVDVDSDGCVDVMLCKPGRTLFDDMIPFKLEKSLAQSKINTISSRIGGLDYDNFQTIKKSGKHILRFRDTKLSDWISSDEMIHFQFRFRNATIYRLSGELIAPARR